MTCNRTALAALVFAAFLAGSPAAATEGPDAPARRGLDPARALLYFHAPAVVAHTAHASVQAPIPAFARMYGTGCSTCHAAAPKLNVLGEAFRLAGYRMPDSELLVRKDGPVPLGADPWKDQWPRAVWPGDLPGLAPLALRVQTDIRAVGRPEGGHDVDFRFPHEVYLLAGAPIGEDVAAFLELEYKPGEGVELVQAKVGFQDFLPGLPDGAANLWLGRQDPFFFTFTDRQIDRAGLVGFSWQRFSLSDVLLTDAGGSELRSGNELVLGGTLATIEVNGVLAGRLHYGAGLSQGGGDGPEDSNGHKDAFYRLRYKFGGLDLRGRYDPGDGPVLGAGGQLQDRSVILENFGYVGDESTSDAPAGGHWASGLSVRGLWGPWDVGVGWVFRSFARPWGGADGALDARTWFAKAEYFVFPWLMASLKYDRLDAWADAAAIPAGYAMESAATRSVAPGAVLLVRQNVRALVEARFLLDGDAARLDPMRPTGDLFVRLDLTF